MYEAHCMSFIVAVCDNLTNILAPVFAAAFTQTVVCKCYCTTTTTPWCPLLTCDTSLWHIYLSVQLTIVCSTCVEPCWVPTAALSNTFCVQKHLSALGEKMLVILQSLPWVVKKRKTQAMKILPPTLFPPFNYQKS